MRILLIACLLMLVACMAPQNSSGIKAAEPPPKMDSVAEPSPKKALEEKMANGKPGVVDYSCKTSSDCKIKDVGSCCGYRPACVNKDSPTFAAEVKSQCGKEGMAGICGFPSIGSCTCTNNKCEGVTGSSGEEVTQ
jgi:hypothetical protein